MTTAADHQRTIVIGLTVLFVLLIVGVSLLSLGDEDTESRGATAQATTVPFGPLGNGVATCERTTDGPFVVLYSVEEPTPKTFTFRVELRATDATTQSVLVRAEDVTSARQAALVVVPEDTTTPIESCRITGIQQDKRVLTANS